MAGHGTPGNAPRRIARNDRADTAMGGARRFVADKGNSVAINTR